MSPNIEYIISIFNFLIILFFYKKRDDERFNLVRENLRQILYDHQRILFRIETVWVENENFVRAVGVGFGHRGRDLESLSDNHVR